MMKELIKAGSDVNKTVGNWNRTPIHISVVTGDISVLETLIKKVSIFIRGSPPPIIICPGSKFPNNL